jgi:hypothetical protein
MYAYIRIKNSSIYLILNKKCKDVINDRNKNEKKNEMVKMKKECS